MTQYLLSVHHAEGGPGLTEEQMRQSYEGVAALNKELQAAGVWVFAGGLEAPSSASVVRAQGGQIVTTDGPFAETKEQLGGFWVIEVPTGEVAREWAAKATVACLSPVEVRPFQGV